MSKLILKSKIKDLNRPFSRKSVPRIKKKLWLDKNENLDEVLTNFNNKILNQLDYRVISTYPEAANLYKKISRLYKINDSQLLLTNGSDGGIKMTFEIFINKNDKVLIMNPTFAMYEVYCKIFKANYRTIDYETKNNKPNIDVKSIIKNLNTFKPKLFCLANPDSPTGNFINKKNIINILDTSKKNNTLFLIDEAYFHFCKFSIIKLINKYENLIVVRTFSKAWGVAGIRLGFVASNSKIIEIYNNYRPMYEVSSLSIAIMEKLINYPKKIDDSVKRLIQGKKYFLKLMKNLKFNGFDTYGNFLFIDFGEYSKIINESLQKNILIRNNFSHDSLKNYTRFSATTKKNYYSIYKHIIKILKTHNLLL